MPALELYAPDKGRYARWIIGVTAVILLGYGAWSLYYALPDSWRQPLMGWRPLGDAYPLSLSLLLSAIALAGGAFGIWWAINYKRLVNFLHDVEVEMTKVSWASKKEVVASSVVVLVTTVILAGWVGLVDAVLYGIRVAFGG